MTGAELIKKALKTRGMSQAKLAEAAGYAGQGAISMVLSRKNGVRCDVLVKLLNCMGYEVVIRDKISGKDLCVLDMVDEEAEK